MLGFSDAATASTVLLERADHVHALERQLEAVKTSSAGRVVFISGEAGVGKTSVVRHLCARQTVPILTGACDTLAAPHPLGPLLDMASTTGGGLNEVVAGGGRPHQVAAALLDHLRSEALSIVVLEDLHWADDATLDVVRLLSRRVETAPVLVIATYRDDQVDRAHPLRVLIGELATERAVLRLTLAPLSLAAVVELAAPYDLDPTELYESTGGNPFFVTEVLAGGGRGLPPTVQDAVLARVARLRPAARRLLEAVAVVPAGVTVDLLEALDATAVASVEECLASGVLAATPGGVAFRHELARQAVEISLPPTRRVALNRAVLAALSDPRHGPPDPTRLSHHADAARDAEAVVLFAPQAAAIAARVGAHREAAAQYSRALQHEHQLSDETRAELLSLRATECYLTGDFQAAIESRQSARNLYRQLGDRRREGDALRAMSANLRCHGLVTEAADAGRTALAVLEALTPGRELALAFANLAMLALNHEDIEQTRTWGARALELAERVDDRDTLVHALNTVGTAGYLAGAAGGRHDLERSLQLAKRWGFDEHGGRAYIHLAWASVRWHDYGRAEVYQRDGVEYCIERGLDAWRYEILGHTARRQLDQGAWNEATESTSTILRLVHTNAVARTMALATLAVVRARRGDPDHRGPLQEAEAIAAPAGELQHLLPVALAAAEIAWLEGGTGASAAVEAATGNALDLAVRCGAGPAIGMLAAWRRRCGVQEAIPPGAAGLSTTELSGDVDAAASAWRQLGCEYEAAIVLCGSDAEDHNRQALATFHRFEARPAAALAARRLRERGVRSVPRGPRPSTARHPARLTNREVEVLALVAQDLRNREIAGRLHLSEKTVDHHVATIIAKLGVRSRAQAVAAAARLDESLPGGRVTAPR